MKAFFCEEQCWVQLGLDFCDDTCHCLNLNEGNGMVIQMAGVLSQLIHIFKAAHVQINAGIKLISVSCNRCQQRMCLYFFPRPFFASFTCSQPKICSICKYIYRSFEITHSLTIQAFILPLCHYSSLNIYKQTNQS